jgi:hypothetical protein
MGTRTRNFADAQKDGRRAPRKYVNLLRQDFLFCIARKRMILSQPTSPSLQDGRPALQSLACQQCAARVYFSGRYFESRWSNAGRVPSSTFIVYLLMAGFSSAPVS